MRTDQWLTSDGIHLLTLACSHFYETLHENEWKRITRRVPTRNKCKTSKQQRQQKILKQH